MFGNTLLTDKRSIKIKFYGQALNVTVLYKTIFYNSFKCMFSLGLETPKIYIFHKQKLTVQELNNFILNLL